MTYRGAGCGKATCPVLRGAWVATDALGSPMVELGTHSATERAELETLHLPESVHREHPAYSTVRPRKEIGSWSLRFQSGRGQNGTGEDRKVQASWGSPTGVF